MNSAISGIGGSAAPIVSGASSYSAAASLYRQVDVGGTGSISATQLAEAVGSPSFSGVTSAGNTVRPPIDAQAIFDQLSSDGSATVSRQDFISGLSKLIRSWQGNDASSASTTPSQTLTSGLDEFQQLTNSRSSNGGNSLDVVA